MELHLPWSDWLFHGARLQGRSRDGRTNGAALRAWLTRRKLLLLSLLCNLGILATFKYGNFLIENFIAVSGSLSSALMISPLDALLPVGISFYTFQSLSYTLDVYRGDSKPRQSLLDSRTQHGLDHVAINAAAAHHGKFHANMSVSGGHWLTVATLVEWLAKNEPQLSGGIITTEIPNFLGVGNGSYELTVIEPFRNLTDFDRAAKHVPWQRDELGTYGVYSALFSYRDDIQQLISHPLDRKRQLQANAGIAPLIRLTGNTPDQPDMCRYGFADRRTCDAVAADPNPLLPAKLLCDGNIRGAGVPSVLPSDHIPAEFAAQADSVRQILRNVRWPKPPLLVLMPIPRMMQEHIFPQNLHAMTLMMLAPLVAEGRIELLDMTSALDDSNGPPGNDCRMYHDFYHESPAGRAQLTALLLPKLEAYLYR